MNLENQYGNFTRIARDWATKLGGVEASRRLKEAVYLIAIGGNDYFSFNSNNPDASFFQMEEYVDQVIGNLSIVIKVQLNSVPVRSLNASEKDFSTIYISYTLKTISKSIF